MCSDLSKEFQRFDEKPEKYFKSFEGIRVSPYVRLAVSICVWRLNFILETKFEYLNCSRQRPHRLYISSLPFEAN